MNKYYNKYTKKSCEKKPSFVSSSAKLEDFGKSLQMRPRIRRQRRPRKSQKETNAKEPRNELSGAIATEHGWQHASTEHCYRACFIEVMLLSQLWCCRWTKSWSTGYWQLGLDTLRYPRYPGGNGKSWSTCQQLIFQNVHDLCSWARWCRRIAFHRTESTAGNTAATEHDDPFNKLIKDIFANELTAEQKKKPHPSRRKNAASSTSSCEKNWVMLESLSTYSSTAFLHYWSNLFAKINNKPTDDAEKWNSASPCNMKLLQSISLRSEPLSMQAGGSYLTNCISWLLEHLAQMYYGQSTCMNCRHSLCMYILKCTAVLLLVRVFGSYCGAKWISDVSAGSGHAPTKSLSPSNRAMGEQQRKIRQNWV